MIKKSVDINDVLITPLKIISVPNGDVMHAMKSSDEGYENFGEAYFSTINSGDIKAWKRHIKMTLNLVVPSGKVKFVLYDDRQKSQSYGNYSEVIISGDNYCRLTVPPMLWLGFQGLYNKTSIILNIANIEHSPEEVEKKEIDQIFYNWGLD
jgi:dTDP-4-dehydrorhamnose 3,5-epimerase